MPKKFQTEQGNLLPYYWLNGELFHREKDGVPVVSTFSQAMDYSVLVIEGIRVNVDKSGRCFGFRLKDHVKRLFESWKFLGFSSPHSFQKIYNGLFDCIQNNLQFLKETGKLQSLYVRPKIYHSDSVIKPLAGHQTNIVIECFPLGNYVSTEGIQVTLADFVRTYKYSSYITKGFGKYAEYGFLRDSEKSAYEDILQLGLGKGGRLIFTEGTTSNVFFVVKGKILTPADDDFLLKGITRDSVIHMARYLGIPCEKKEVPLHLILESEEIFLTGTASFITSVKQIGRYKLGAGPITQKLSVFFEKVRMGKIAHFSQWLTSFDL